MNSGGFGDISLSAIAQPTSRQRLLTCIKTFTSVRRILLIPQSLKLRLFSILDTDQVLVLIALQDHGITHDGAIFNSVASPSRHNCSRSMKGTKQANLSSYGTKQVQISNSKLPTSAVQARLGSVLRRPGFISTKTPIFRPKIKDQVLPPKRKAEGRALIWGPR